LKGKLLLQPCGSFVLCVCAPPLAVGPPGALSMSGTPAAGTIRDPHESGSERVVIYGRSTMYRNWPNTSSGVPERFRRATQHTASEEEGDVRGALSTSVEQIRVCRGRPPACRCAEQQGPG